MEIYNLKSCKISHYKFISSLPLGCSSSSTDESTNIEFSIKHQLEILSWKSIKTGVNKRQIQTKDPIIKRSVTESKPRQLVTQHCSVIKDTMCENWWMNYPEPVTHHQALKLKDNPFIEFASHPIWPGLYTASCRQNIKHNNGTATVGTAGGRQLLLGIADDLKPLQSQLLSVVFTCLWRRSKLHRTATHSTPPNAIPGTGQRTPRKVAACEVFTQM